MMEKEWKGLSYLILLEEVVPELRGEVVYALFMHEEILTFRCVVEDLDGISSEIGNHIPWLILQSLLRHVSPFYELLDSFLHCPQGLPHTYGHLTRDIDVNLVGDFYFKELIFFYIACHSRFGLGILHKWFPSEDEIIEVRSFKFKLAVIDLILVVDKLQERDPVSAES